MNQTEAVQMLYILTRAGLVRALEDQGSVWANALPDIRIEDAVAVTNNLVRERTGTDRWVTPGDIRQGVTALRLARHTEAARNGGGVVQPPETIDADDIQRQLAWRRAYNAAIGDGHDVGRADVIACHTVNATRPQIEGTKPVDHLVEQVARSLPRVPRKDAA